MVGPSRGLVSFAFALPFSFWLATRRVSVAGVGVASPSFSGAVQDWVLPSGGGMTTSAPSPCRGRARCVGVWPFRFGVVQL